MHWHRSAPPHRAVPVALLRLEAEQWPLWHCHQCACARVEEKHSQSGTGRSAHVQAAIFRFQSLRSLFVQCQSNAGDFAVRHQLGQDNLVRQQFSHSHSAASIS